MWHCPFIAQVEHPQPQEDLPAFLFFIMLRMISPKTRATIAKITIVPMLGICVSPFIWIFSSELPFLHKV